MMHIVWTVLIGFLAGLVAKALTPGSGPGGFLMTTALGMAGSVVATYLGDMLGLYHAGDVAGFIASVIGAIVLLVVYHLVARK